MELVIVFGVLAVGCIIHQVGLRTFLEGLTGFAVCGMLVALVGWVLSYYM